MWEARKGVRVLLELGLANQTQKTVNDIEYYILFSILRASEARYGKYVLANFVAAIASFHLIPQTTMYEAKWLRK